MGFFFLFFFSFLPALTGDLGILWKGNGDSLGIMEIFERKRDKKILYVEMIFNTYKPMIIYIYMLSKIRSLHL